MTVIYKLKCVAFIFFGVICFSLGILGLQTELEIPTLGEHIFSLSILSVGIIVGLISITSGVYILLGKEPEPKHL